MYKFFYMFVNIVLFIVTGMFAVKAQSACAQLTGTQRDECIRQRNVERQQRLLAAQRAAQIRDSLEQTVNNPPLVVTIDSTSVAQRATQIQDSLPQNINNPSLPVAVDSALVREATQPSTLSNLLPNDNEPDTATTQPEIPEDGVLEIADIMPELIGGMAALNAQVVYPPIAGRAGIHGRVIVQFVVDEYGKVNNPVVLTPIGAGCDEEAVRVIMNAKFMPGQHNGKPAKVRISIPIRFRLN